MDTENFLNKKMTSFRKSLFTFEKVEIIKKQLENIFTECDKIEKNQTFEILDELLNITLTQKTVRNRSYCNIIITKILSKYADFLSITNDINIIALIFFKYFKEKLNLYYYDSVLNLLKSIDISEEISTLYENKDIYNIFNKFEDIVNNNINYLSSRHICFQAIPRNQLIMSLYEHYKENRQLSIWMPTGGFAEEGYIISLICNLLYQTEFNSKISNFNITISLKNKNSNYTSETNFTRITNKIIEDFKKENSLKDKEIRLKERNISSCITTIENDFYNDAVFPDNKHFDIILINTIKTENYLHLTNRVKKLIEIIKDKNRKDFKLIIETPYENELEPEKYIIDEKKAIVINNSGYHIENTNKKLSYLIYDFKTTPSDSQQTDNNDIETLLEKVSINENNPKTLKKELLKININLINKPEHFLKYASLCENAKLYEKSYTITRDHYQTDIEMSIKILNNIIANCKNSKITNKVKNFIEEKHLNDKNYSNNLIKSISDGIEYFENTDDLANITDFDETKWL